MWVNCQEQHCFSRRQMQKQPSYKKKMSSSHHWKCSDPHTDAKATQAQLKLNVLVMEMTWKWRGLQQQEEMYARAKRKKKKKTKQSWTLFYVPRREEKKACAFWNTQSSIRCSDDIFNNGRHLLYIQALCFDRGGMIQAKSNTINTWGNLAAFLQESLLSQATESLVLVRKIYRSQNPLQDKRTHKTKQVSTGRSPIAEAQRLRKIESLIPTQDVDKRESRCCYPWWAFFFLFFFQGMYRVFVEIMLEFLRLQH